MLASYPVSIVVHGLALNITAQSYDRSLDFGLVADAKAMPDVAALADDLRVAFDDLRALAVPDDEPTAGEIARGVARRAGRGLGAVVDRTVPRPVVDAARGATVFGAAVGSAVGKTLGNTDTMRLLGRIVPDVAVQTVGRVVGTVRDSVSKATKAPGASPPAKARRRR
jgi:hypothetical protein